jgi:hypothetical protein
MKHLPRRFDHHGFTRRDAIAFATASAFAWTGPALAADAVVLRVGPSRLAVTLASDAFDAGRQAILDWIATAGHSVATYFGGFPVPEAAIEVRFREGGSGIHGAVTFGDPPRTRIGVGQHTLASELGDDWTMTHEMVHYGFPNMPRNQHWIEEGLATYVEPIARAQAGTLSAERVWGDMVRDMPKGLPDTGDQGLDHTHTWARTYWGGALFALLADVRSLEHSHKRGLQEALRAIVRAGGIIDNDWPIEDALRIGDKAIGSTVLTTLYGQMKDTPMNVDLGELWSKLGVGSDRANVEFRSDAPLARVREAIMRKRA